jgi:hypothetical protein
MVSQQGNEENASKSPGTLRYLILVLVFVAEAGGRNLSSDHRSRVSVQLKWHSNGFITQRLLRRDRT